jgi:hypothetical protein
VIQEVRTLLGLVPSYAWGEAQGVVNGGGLIFRLLGITGREFALLVGGTDYPSALYTAPGEENGLDRPPVIAARELGLGDLEDARGAPELAGHHHEGVLQQSTFAEVVKEDNVFPFIPAGATLGDMIIEKPTGKLAKPTGST